MNNIFLITTISTTNKKFSYSRTVGYFKDLNEAKEIVENNCYDLFETFYDYAVIEEVPEGIYPLYENQVWYKWNLKENKYERLCIPFWLLSVDDICLLLDVDDVICDNGFMYLVNSFLGTNYTLADVKSYYVEEDLMTPEQIPAFYDYIADKNTYDHSYIFEGAYEGLKALNEKYEV